MFWGWHAPSVWGGSCHPSTWHELVRPQPPDPVRVHGAGSWGACALNNSHSGEAKRNFQEERAPRAPPPPGATGLHALTLAAGATAAGAAASAGARHKGRLCSRSPGCLPRAILLAPGRLPAPAAHTRAFHEGSGDDLLPGGRGRGRRMEPRHAGPGTQPLVRARYRRAPRVSEAEGLAGGSPLLRQAWGRVGPPALSAPCLPPCCPVCGALGMHSLPGHPAASELPPSLGGWGTLVPCGAAADGSSPRGWRWGDRGSKRRVLGKGCTRSVGRRHWHNPPLVELLAWRRLRRCCWQRAAGGGAALP